MAIKLKSWGEQLSIVQEAIEAAQNNQRYEFNGRMVQRGDLEHLHAREKYLVAKLETDGDVIVGATRKRGVAKVIFS